MYDLNRFLTMATHEAQGHIAGGYSPEDAATMALKDAHAFLSQKAFFAMLDALGGQLEAEKAIVQHLHG